MRMLVALEISFSHLQEELFNINQYPVKLLEVFMTDTRAIIVVKKLNNLRL
jgi:hypothetical protein